MADDSATHAPTAYASSVSIEWKRLTFTITKKGKCGKKDETIKILQGVDGFLPGGRLLAVMGPSGSGKTSFINMIKRATLWMKTLITLRSLKSSIMLL